METITPRKQYDCIVLGAGLSGLASGFSLLQKNKSYLVLESQSRSGGVIISEVKDGFIVEYGPNSAVLTPEIDYLITALSIKEHLLQAKPQSNIRQIIWNGRLHTLKPSPKTIVTTSLLSFSGKLRLLKELFIRSKSAAGESVHDFFKRRLGKEAAERMAGAIVSGIYAGDPNKLAVAAVFPRLVALENEYGSIIKGLIKSKGPARTIINFKKGLQTLTNSIEEVIKENVQLQVSITSITRATHGTRWLLNYTVNNEQYQAETDHIISTIPAYALKNISGTPFPNLDIAYNTMLTLQVAVPKGDFFAKTIGFGFLASPYEREDFIGVMLNGNIFETAQNETEALMNFFVKPDKCKDSHPEAIFKNLCTPLFRQWTGIEAPLRLISHKLWPQAIPQKSTSHLNWLDEVSRWQQANPGFHIAGNFVYGVAVGDCVKDHFELIDAIFTS